MKRVRESSHLPAITFNKMPDLPELLFAVNLHGFLRRTPFHGVLFRVEDGRLVLEEYE